MKLLAPILILMTCCLCQVVSGSQQSQKLALIDAYEDLSSLRSTDSALLKGGDGVFVIQAENSSLLEALDIILTVNDKPIYSVADLYLKIALNDKSDGEFRVALQRDGELIRLQVARSDFSVLLSDMAPGEVSQIISENYQDTEDESDGEEETQSQYALVDEYLKGRPLRTPNNMITKIK